MRLCAPVEVPTRWCHSWCDCYRVSTADQFVLIAGTLWTLPLLTAYAFNYSLTIETVSALLARKNVCVSVCVCLRVLIHMCLCARACVQMTLQPAVHTKAVCFNAAGSQNTLGGAQTKSTEERKRVCVLNLVLRTCRRGQNMPVCANGGMCIFVSYVHFVLASALCFLAAGPKESRSRVNFKL